MFVYRNNNTGDTVQYEHRSARLEMLPNWVVLQEPTPQVPRELEDLGDAGTSAEGPPGEGGGDGDGPDAAERPARSASKAEWQAYARTRAQDSDEEAAIDGLTKEQLIEQYGSDPVGEPLAGQSGGNS